MTWQMVLEALKGSAMVTPVFMCVLYCALMLFMGVKEYGWMVAAKVAVILVATTLVAAAIQLVITWVLHWGN